MRLPILPLVGLVATLILFANAADSESAAGLDLSVTVSTTSEKAITGDSFVFTSTITNLGSEATPRLVANLDFVSLDGKTYIDPEDWSHQRTIHLDAIAPNSSSDQTWTVEPVLGGDIAVYVVVLPAPIDRATAGPLASSPAIHVHVTERRALNPGGVLPVVLAVPAVLGLVALGLRKSRTRI